MKTKALRLLTFLLVSFVIALSASLDLLAIDKGVDVEADGVVLNKRTSASEGGYYTVDVPIRITKNSGFVSLRFYAYHPETVELVGWAEGEIFPSPNSANLTPPIDMNATENGILVFYNEGMSVNNKTSTGILITLRYNVPQDTLLGDLEINLVLKDAYEEDGDRYTEPDKITLYCTVKSGKISVVEVEPDCGDVNSNGSVDTLDVICLARHLGEWVGYTDIEEAASDTNGDGEVTLVDLVCLSRHIAGWTDYADLPIEQSE